MTKILYGKSEKSSLECAKNGFKKHLPALFPRELFHVCIINNRLVQFQLFEKLTRANYSKLNSKPYDYLY